MARDCYNAIMISEFLFLKRPEKALWVMQGKRQMGGSEARSMWGKRVCMLPCCGLVLNSNESCKKQQPYSGLLYILHPLYYDSSVQNC